MLLIANLLYYSDDQIFDICKAEGLIEVAVQSLPTDDTQLVLEVLDSLDQVLKRYQDVITESGKNVVRIYLETLDFDNILENLQYHKSEKVYEKVIGIIENFFT